MFATEDGTIHGLSIKRPDGMVERVGCDAVIFACNGFGGNRVMVDEFIPEMSDSLILAMLAIKVTQCHGQNSWERVWHKWVPTRAMDP